MSDGDFVCDLWQRKMRHTLSPERRAEFLARREVAKLSTYPPAVLIQAADKTLVLTGRLLLPSWCVWARTFGDDHDDSNGGGGGGDGGRGPERPRRPSGGPAVIRQKELEGPRPRRGGPANKEVHKRISDILKERPDYN